MRREKPNGKEITEKSKQIKLLKDKSMEAEISHYSAFSFAVKENINYKIYNSKYSEWWRSYD